MKKTIKLLLPFFILFLSVLLVKGETQASVLNEKDLLRSNDVSISITNDETGETKFISPLDSKNTMRANTIKANNGSIEVGYEVFVPIEIPDASVSYSSKGGQQNEAGVTAKLNVDYDVSGNNEKVRLNKLYGSWTPSSSLYSLTNRSVGAHSGVPYGKRISKDPTSNSFSYTTGWGYNDRLWGDSAPRAWSSAKINISGMTATYTIKVEFTYS